MKGLFVKRGVEATLERVFRSTGNRFGELKFRWTGSTAAVAFDRQGASLTAVNATFIFPVTNDLAEIGKALFNDLIAFSLHELGHVWFTDNSPWDHAKYKYGTYLSALINGLEDPRIERKVIESGYAPNSKALLESLMNNMLRKHGYVEPDDLPNLSFMLAIEGRRLNGYAVEVPSIVDQSPWAAAIWEALHAARAATNTAGVVAAAIKLFEKLQQQKDDPSPVPSEQPQPQPQPQPKPKQPEQGDEDGEGSEGGDPADDQQGDEQGDESGDEQGDESGDEQGGDEAGGEGGDEDASEAAQEGAGDDKSGDEGEGEGEGENGADGDSGEPSDGTPTDGEGEGVEDHESEAFGVGAGKGSGSREMVVGRLPDPADYICDQIAEKAPTPSKLRDLPSVDKPTIMEFKFY